MTQDPGRAGLKRVPAGLKYTSSPDTTKYLVGQRIRDLRALRNWTVRELADRCVHPLMTRGTIAKIESGRRQFVTHDEVDALAAAFGLSRKDFLNPRPAARDE